MPSIFRLRNSRHLAWLLIYGLTLSLAAPSAMANAGMAYIKNHTSQMIYVWINGSYQGGVPGGKMAYTVVEGFVTPESGFDESGELKTEHSHGGWKPSGDMTFLARGPLREDGTFFYTESTFPDSGSGITIWAGSGEQPEVIEKEFAIKILKTSPSGNYANALKKGSAPDAKSSPGGSSNGGSLAPMVGGVQAGPGEGKNFKNSIGMEMVWVAPLRMWIGKYEVTQGEYQTISGSNPSMFQSGRRPVEGVRWNEATAFVQALNARENDKLPIGFSYRLPTDAEYDLYVGNASLEDAVTDSGRIHSGTASVGSLRPNNYGLFDTRGNVTEWMTDWYTMSIYEKDSYSGKKVNMVGRQYKVRRGGSWDGTYPETLDVAYRHRSAPDEFPHLGGFRVVISSVPN